MDCNYKCVGSNKELCPECKDKIYPIGIILPYVDILHEGFELISIGNHQYQTRTR